MSRAMSLEHCSDETQSPRLDNISEKNEERRDICISTTSNPIRSDNKCQFTKLARQNSRVKYIQIDSVIQAHPDERTHLTNTEVTSSDINEMNHVMNKGNRPPNKERDKPPPPSQTQLTTKNLKRQCSSVGIA